MLCFSLGEPAADDQSCPWAALATICVSSPEDGDDQEGGGLRGAAWPHEEATSQGATEGEKGQPGGLRGGTLQCLCPRGHWRTNRERAWTNDAPIWIQCAADAAVALLRRAYELSSDFQCGCKFAGYQSLFGGKKLTEEDCLSDGLVVFHWEPGAFQHTYTSKVLYEELARAFEVHCAPGVPCDCKVGALIEVPPEMAERLLQCDVPRRTAMTVAKLSEDLAASAFPFTPSRPLKVLAATPLHLLRDSSMYIGHLDVQLPAQKPLSCVYIGQPKGDKDNGNFAHAALEWSSPGGAPETGIVFEWQVQRGDRWVVAQTDPPLRYGGIKRNIRVPLPEHFTVSKELLNVFEEICHRSLAKLARKYRPPCTIIACRLLGSPKHETVGPQDMCVLAQDDGLAVEHLLTAPCEGQRACLLF